MAKLVIAEKPSVAKGIYPVIGATTKRNGYFEGNGYLVSWCFGHLVRMKMPDEYGETWAARPWTFSMLPMIPERWAFQVGKDCKEQFQLLKKLMEDSSVDEIICATDADREGECIFRYVYDLAGCKKPVKRLWISSLEESAVRAGFAALKDGRAYDPLFRAGLCRAKADWLVGMNGSRLFSIRYRQRLTLGRVQTPTLAMIVQRDYDVAHFVKQKYLTVVLHCKTDHGAFDASSERIDDADKAAALSSAVTGKDATVKELKKEIKTAAPPKLYDLTTLQREANKFHGYTAQQTLDALQALYEAKLATYPRTDSQYLSDDMEQTALHVLAAVKSVFPVLASDTAPDLSRCINNKKVTGHHAILPTEQIQNADLSGLPQVQQDILYLIAARLAMAAEGLHRYEAVKVTVLCEGELFTATGKSILEEGWKQTEARFKSKFKKKDADEDSAEKEQKLPALTEGQVLENVTGSVQEHWTSPPKPYTEDTLLSAMEHAGQEDYDDETEKKGLGTPATRAGIIEGLVKHGYAERSKKNIIATEKGVSLIAVVPEEVKSPKLTADWEMTLQQIEHGKSDDTAFMDSITAYVKKLCATYSTTDESVSFRKETPPIGKCPHCGGDVQKGKYGFYCTKKCGMSLAKVYGKELTEAQLVKLLSGKKISYTANDRKTIVLPEVVENQYQGKTYYQWKTQKGS